MRHGYGATRGTPVGRQRASGSSAAMRESISAFAAGNSTISSPGSNPSLMSPTGPPPTHTPEKSGVPSGNRGAGPSGTSPISAGLFAPPLPAGDAPSAGVFWRERELREGARGQRRDDELQSAHD